MMDLIKKFPILVPVGVASGLLALFGLINQVYDLINLGLPSLVLAAIGGSVLIISIFKLQVNLNNELSKAKLEKTSSTPKAKKSDPKTKTFDVEKKEEPFDYSSWELAEEFEIGDLSKVLAEQKVSEEGLNDAARGWFNTLDTAIETGKIGGTKRFGNVWVSRKDVENFFKQKGKKHPLFNPEERNESKKPQPPSKVRKPKKGWVFKW